jgi:putative tricarboxylic transport membrane protein
MERELTNLHQTASAPDPTEEKVAELEEEGSGTFAAPSMTRVAALVTLVIGLVSVAGSVGLGVGPLSSPQPGNWPLVIGTGIVAMSLFVFLSAARLPLPERIDRDSWPVLAALVTLLAFAGLVELVGFELLSLLIISIWMRFFGKESWRMTAVVSVLATAAFYLIFVVALGVPIPHLLNFG